MRRLQKLQLRRIDLRLQNEIPRHKRVLRSRAGCFLELQLEGQVPYNYKCNRMTSRLLSSLPLPAAILSALTRGGYENVLDLSDSSPEALAQGLSCSENALSYTYGSILVV